MRAYTRTIFGQFNYEYRKFVVGRRKKRATVLSNAFYGPEEVVERNVWMDELDRSFVQYKGKFWRIAATDGGCDYRMVQPFDIAR